jgi:single-stranded-DNA-specific exonuclease
MKEICAQSLSEKRWLLRSYEETHVLTYMQKLNVSPTLARFLAMRNIELDHASLFLTPSLKSHLPDPLGLKDMDKAIERLVQALHHKEKILVWGDYDVDGATSSALLHRFFKAINYPIAVYIPDRLKEGYGPNAKGIEKFQAQGYRVMITVDCGTTSFEALDALKEIDVIILDHHGAEAKLPRAHAIVNPNRLDEREEITQTLGHLAAVGISFLFVVALNRALREAGFYKTLKEPNLLDLLDLVALGTVCDVMPLTGLNRTFVTQGLKVMAGRKNLGLKTLADQIGLDEAPTTYHLGFLIGPRVNAGGRVGESFLGSRLLSTDAPEEALEIAKQLQNYNEERRALETDAVEQALIQVDPQQSAILVDHDQWHEGVIGIVAGRLKEKYHKPTAVITWNNEGIGKASARSIPGFDFGNFIRKAHHLGYVLGGGGHAMAAGFSLTKDQLPLLKTYLNEELHHVNNTLDLRPILFCDGYLDLRALTLDFMEELKILGPFGMGNPNPKFVFTDVMVQSYQLIKDDHIKCRFSQGEGVVVEGMGFRLAGSPLGKFLMEGKKRPFDLIASPKVDTWGGKAKLTLMIEDGKC